MARLLHPHIVRILDFGIENGLPFLVMEYAPHGSLRQRHPRGCGVPLDTVVSYVEQVAEALHYIHMHKLIHRDVKPENMLLGAHDEVLLTEFDLAVLAHSTRSQHTQEAAGSVTYMAPEQLRGKPRPASDQYALGVTVYEWLSGEPPFSGSVQQIANQHLSLPPLPLHARVPGIPRAIELVVLKALAKDHTLRFASMQAFALALEEASHEQAPGRTSLVSAFESSVQGTSVCPVKSAVCYPDHLTAREVEVLRFVASGLTDAQIAKQLVISPYTVNAHLKTIYSKIAVSSRSAATRYAIEHQLA